MYSHHHSGRTRFEAGWYLHSREIGDRLPPAFGCGLLSGYFLGQYVRRDRIQHRGWIRGGRLQVSHRDYPGILIVSRGALRGATTTGSVHYDVRGLSDRRIVFFCDACERVFIIIIVHRGEEGGGGSARRRSPVMVAVSVFSIPFDVGSVSIRYRCRAQTMWKKTWDAR